MLDRIPLDHGRPGIRHELLVAERDALGARVVLEHDDVDLVADAHHFRGMRDAAPRHVGDVEQAVDAAEVDERAVIGEVLHRAAEHLALRERIERRLLLLGVLFLDEDLAREDDVAALLVDLDDPHAQLLPLQGVEVADGPHINLGSRQEGAHADVDRQSSLDALDDAADDHLAFLVGLLDLVPNFHLLRFFAREHHVALAILGALEQHVDDVVGLRGHLAVLVDELFDRDHAFGFEADVHDHFRGRHLHDAAFHYFPFRDVAEAGVVQFQQARVLLRVHVAVVTVGERREAAVSLRTSCRRVGLSSHVIPHCVAGPPHLRDLVLSRCPRKR